MRRFSRFICSKSRLLRLPESPLLRLPESRLLRLPESRLLRLPESRLLRLPESPLLTLAMLCQSKRLVGNYSGPIPPEKQYSFMEMAAMKGVFAGDTNIVQGHAVGGTAGPAAAGASSSSSSSNGAGGIFWGAFSIWTLFIWGSASGS